MRLSLRTKATKYYQQIVSFIWGLLEATIFFIIPDVFISWLALKGFKPGFKSVFWTLLGSLSGATLLFFLALNFELHSYLTAIPLTTAQQVQDAQAHLTQQGEYGVVWGPLKGIPHKIYTVYAADNALNLTTFLWFSAWSRATRFCFVAVISSLVAFALRRIFKISHKALVWLFAIAWLIIYAFYFAWAL